MAYLNFKKSMAFWDIEIGGSRLTNMLKKYISGMAFEYSLSGPPLAQISVTSESFMEDIMVEGTTIKANMGWDRLVRAQMISGKIVTPPDGKASQMLGYTLTVAHDSIEMAKFAKNKIYTVPKKSAVVSQVIGEYGYTPVVAISDASPISPKELPIQKNETPMAFLYRCAAKWNCLTWVNNNIFYFVDADKAHNYGNLDRLLNIEDLTSEYELGYRVSGKKNNIADLSWKFGTKGGGVKGAKEDGATTQPEDFDIEIAGQYYKLKPSIQKEIAGNSGATAKYLQLVVSAEASRAKDALREYFVPVTHGSQTNKNKSHPAAHKAGKLTLSINLNHGDPFLRPPRTAVLDAGSEAIDSDLPGFLFRGGKPKQYNINKVRTELANGMIKTKLQLSLGK